MHFFLLLFWRCVIEEERLRPCIQWLTLVSMTRAFMVPNHFARVQGESSSCVVFAPSWVMWITTAFSFISVANAAVIFQSLKLCENCEPHSGCSSFFVLPKLESDVALEERKRKESVKLEILFFSRRFRCSLFYLNGKRGKKRKIASNCDCSVVHGCRKAA